MGSPLLGMRGSVTRLVVHRSVVLGLVVSVAVMVGMGVYTSRTVAEFADSSKWVSHTLGVLQHLENLTSLVTGFENERRAFWLSNDENHLANSNELLSHSIPDEIQTIQKLTEDNESQQERLRLISRRVQSLTASLLKTSSRPAEDASIDKLHNELTQALSAMVAEENRLLTSRVKQEDNNGAHLNNTTWMRLGIALAIIFVALFQVNRGMAAREQAELERDRFFTVSLDMLCIAGTNGYFKRLNPAFEQVLGFSPLEMCSRPILDFVHPDDVQRTTDEIEKQSKGSPVLFV